MRLSLLLSTALLLPLPCAIASAQTAEAHKDLTVTAGVFSVGDPAYRQSLGHATGLAIEKCLRRNKDSELSLRVGWFRASESSDGLYAGESAHNQLDFVPLQVIKRSGLAYSSKSDTGTYFGYGAGLALTRSRANATVLNEFTSEYDEYSFSEDAVNLSFTLLAGWRFSKSAFAEIDLCWGGNKESTGIITSVGARF